MTICVQDTVWRRCLLILLSLLLSGCQNLPSILSGATALGTPSILPLAALPPTPQASRTWPDADQDVSAQRAREFGLVHMPQMQAYLNALLDRIKAAAGHSDWPGSVHILASTTLNAYATQAGNIYISQAWLQNIQSEDEIVALLAHEFGHIYLHYHQLEGAIETSDTVAILGLLGMALAAKADKTTANETANTLFATLVGYTLSRTWLSSAWSRAHESAADSFGLNISLKLGYSYEAGYKPLLERLASWEEEQDARQAAQKAALFQAVKQQAAENYRKRQGNANSPLDAPLAEVHGAVAGMLHHAVEAVSSLFAYGARQHPDIHARIDDLALLVDAHADAIYDRPATIAPWQRAVGQRTTAAILTHYQQAAQALSNPQDPAALRLAQQAAQGPTATHALPLLARYSTLMAQRPSRNGYANLLNINLASRQHRAWFMYMAYAQTQKQRGQYRQALATLTQGLRHFEYSDQAWVQAITFAGNTAGWGQVKELAATCAKKMPDYTAACRNAAVSPAERDSSTSTASSSNTSLDDLHQAIKDLVMTGNSQ